MDEIVVDLAALGRLMAQHRQARVIDASEHVDLPLAVGTLLALARLFLCDEEGGFLGLCLRRGVLREAKTDLAPGVFLQDGHADEQHQAGGREQG